jgi:dTDP-glucose 4,6-dehydratase
VVILSAIEGRPIPLYGDGANVRDWLFVEDHAEALLTVLEKGQLGETYGVSAETEVSNRALVERLCDHLDALRPRQGGRHADLIQSVSDRPGHDFRYALDASKLRRDLGWRPRTGLDEGLERTVRWHLDNPGWWTRLRERGFVAERLGASRRAGA